MKGDEVDVTVATTIAERYVIEAGLVASGPTRRTATLTPKKVEEKLTVAEKGKPTFYVFNFEGGGFLILSATKKYYPVLAKATTGYFAISDSGEALSEWINHTKEKLYKLSTSSEELPDKDLIKLRWQHLGVVDGGKNPAGGRTASCDYTYPVYLGPLTYTVCGQDCGYNTFTPTVSGQNCGCITNDHTPTGCVATAMAQLMKYWTYPGGYSYGSMPNTGGGTATAQLMIDAGTAVSMNYTCQVSTANYTNATSALLNTFGYSSAQYLSSPNSTQLRNAIVNDINNSRPVLLGGFRTNENIGHAWVCDGYYIERYCDLYDDYYFSMNWGFEGISNGWYHQSNWDGYNAGRQAIVNIYP